MLFHERNLVPNIVSIIFLFGVDIKCIILSSLMNLKKKKIVSFPVRNDELGENRLENPNAF